MLVSMTGYGQGEVSNRNSRVSVEVRSVNHRYLDFSIKIPKNLSSKEAEVKEMVKEKLQRGRVSVTVSAESDQPRFDVSMNLPLMEKYVTELTRFAKKHGIASDLDINTVAMLPEVFTLEEHEADVEQLWPMVKRGLKQALAQCVKMRQEEGKALETDLRSRLVAINKLIKKVERRAPKVMAHHREGLKERVGRIMEGGRVDRDRWMTEVAVLAERLDFTEEIIRLQSHLAQIKTCLDEGGAVAKKLTYLLQEVHREGTTIASKASDAEVIECMVSLREESERLREQVQNLE